MKPILFLGDTIFSDEVSIDGTLIEIFNSSLFSVVNFEGFISDSHEPLSITEHQFRVLMKTLKCKVICVANNHTLDKGKDGLTKLSSIALSEGIKIIGTSSSPWIIIESKRKKLGIINAVWTLTGVKKRKYLNTFGYNIKRITQQIQKLKKENCSEIVVTLHWGVELELLPHPIQLSMANELITAGADLIVGHHPHLIQPYQEIQGKLVFYSVGNFYIPYSSKTWYYPKETKRGIILVYYDSKRISMVTSTIQGDNIKLFENTIVQKLDNTRLKDYKSYFTVKKVKKHIPTLYKEDPLLLIKYCFIRFLSIVTTTKLFSVIWKKIKPKIQKHKQER